MRARFAVAVAALRRLQRVVARFAQFIDSFDPLINNRST